MRHDGVSLARAQCALVQVRLGLVPDQHVSSRAAQEPFDHVPVDLAHLPLRQRHQRLETRAPEADSAERTLRTLPSCADGRGLRVVAAICGVDRVAERLALFAALRIQRGIGDQESRSARREVKPAGPELKPPRHRLLLRRRHHNTHRRRVAQGRHLRSERLCERFRLQRCNQGPAVVRLPAEDLQLQLRRRPFAFAVAFSSPPPPAGVVDADPHAAAQGERNCVTDRSALSDAHELCELRQARQRHDHRNGRAQVGGARHALRTALAAEAGVG
eukprot:1409020-Rhodomonas_salina.3